MRKILKYISITIMTIFLLLYFIVFFFPLDLIQDNQIEEVNSEREDELIETEILEVSIEENNDENFVTSPNQEIQEQIIDETEQKLKEYNEEISKLDNSNIYDWYIEYKKTNDKYSDLIEKDIDIYDVFDEDELYLLFRIVETEVRDDAYFESKVNVANVIFNRLEHNNFPNTLTKVLTQNNQFSGYKSGIYKKVSVSDMTILACEYAYIFGDTTNGSLYFDSTKGKSWAAKNREYMFTDEVGYNFYK